MKGERRWDIDARNVTPCTMSITAEVVRRGLCGVLHATNTTRKGNAAPTVSGSVVAGVLSRKGIVVRCARFGVASVAIYIIYQRLALSVSLEIIGGIFTALTVD